ncbi:MAG: tRNA dihydrouridine synthase DusB [DPANN group archaeon]|nr:tRNA dihydrouridine synthase DusB [DPANN group archaeon]
MMKIGGVRIDGKTVLAPMCSVTTLPFRILCKRYGAALVFTEMISADAGSYVYYDQKHGFNTTVEEKPVVSQIFGSDPYKLANCAYKMEEMKADIIDINMGCPSLKLSRSNAGAMILKDEKLVADIISSVSSTVSCPVTAKIRMGINSNKDTVKIAKIIEQAGASAITVHARTMKQKYMGVADWDMIKKVKDAVSIPVIGNGDVFSSSDAKRMIDITGCDLVMIGRKAIGNPFIFQQCEHYFKTGEILSEPTLNEKFEAYKTLCSLMEQYLTYKPDLKDYRINACWFTKHVKGGRDARVVMARCKSKEDIDEVINEFCED